MGNCGVIQVEPGFWQELGITDISEVSKKFHLPDNYEVLSIEERADVVDVIVSSEAIPDRGDGEIPKLQIILHFNAETNVVSLDHIKVCQ